MTDYSDIIDQNEILRVVAGSGVHGIAIEGTDDQDELGIFIEPPEHVIGTLTPLNTRTFRTQPEGVRSGPGDLDLVRHSLRKYLALAMKGNPNMLIPLFAPRESILINTSIGEQLRYQRNLIVSQSAVRQHLGYLKAQVDRMTKKRKLPNRPELIKKYGYDTKYASHAVRLAFQAHELVTTGRISLPMPQGFREYVVRIKTGHYSQSEVLESVRHWESQAEHELRHTSLRTEPDVNQLNEWLIETHLTHWGIDPFVDTDSQV